MSKKLCIFLLFLNHSQDNKKEMKGPLRKLLANFRYIFLEPLHFQKLQRRLAYDVKFSIFLNVTIILFFILNPNFFLLIACCIFQLLFNNTERLIFSILFAFLFVNFYSLKIFILWAFAYHFKLVINFRLLNILHGLVFKLILIWNLVSS